MLSMAGILVGLIAVAVAIYFGLVSRKHRELVFSINPVRTKVVTAGKATDLEVLYRNEPLGDIDITAVQLAIWNVGNESIKTEHIRKEITVTTKPQVRILEASVRTQSYETEFNLLDSTDSKFIGKVPVSWKILERKEGASIQLLYLGTPEVDVSVEGLIEGQGHPKQIEASTRFKTPQEYHKARRKQILWSAISFFVLVVIAILRFVFEVQEELVSMLFVFSMLIFFSAIIGLISTMRERLPPFGF